MIRKAIPGDAVILAKLSVELWPHNDLQEMRSEFENYLKNPECALFLSFEENEPIGFAQCQLRYDYVEGTQTSPVGYLEGIYVREEHRRHGIARQLLNVCESWAREVGCREFASDCELTNTQSFTFHLRLGFAEANRIICFTKQL